MVMEYKSGKMVLSMKVIGHITKLADKENSGTLMEMFLKENG